MGKVSASVVILSALLALGGVVSASDHPGSASDCEKCHTDGGSYAGDDAGLLAGQWIGYLEQVFADYAAGERSMMEDKMKEKVEALDEASMKALIHYYASQQ